jgi:RNA-directed DNA polymerase
MSKRSKYNDRMFLGFDCEISMKSRSRIVDEWKRMNFQRLSTLNLHDLAEMLNAKSRGIMNYFGRMNIWSMVSLFRLLDQRIAKWVKNKFKRLNSYQKAYDWLRDIKSKHPTIFAHWSISTI